MLPSPFHDGSFQALLAQTVGGIGVAAIRSLDQPVDALRRITHLDIFREVQLAQRILGDVESLLCRRF